MPALPEIFSAARLTPFGRGAVATVRVCGDLTGGGLSLPATLDQPLAASGRERSPLGRIAFDELFHAANDRPLASQPLRRIVFGRWGRSNPEDVVICRLAPDVTEIHCHGGEAAVERVLGDLAAAGGMVIDWQDQITLSGNPFEAECLAVLSQTTTWRTTSLVLEQTGGLLKSAFEELRDSGDSAESWKDRLEKLLAWSELGLHLSTPWNVVLTGRPNVGKSSLINALLGYRRAIVFDQPGTTRDVVTGETAFDGWPVNLADTAGIRDAASGLESAGIAMARDRLRTADLVVVVIDTSTDPTSADLAILAEWPEALTVAHKSDLENRWADALPNAAIPVSSMTGEGLQTLQQQLIKRLIPNVPGPGIAIPLTARQIELLQEMRFAAEADRRNAALERLLAFRQN